MVGVAGLVREVELLKKDRYNKDNEHHESLLSQVGNYVLCYFLRNYCAQLGRLSYPLHFVEMLKRAVHD